MKPNKNISLYWKCQLLGWSLAGLFWAFSAWMQVQNTPQHRGFSFQLALLHFILDIVIGIAVTHAYYLFAHKLNWVGLKLKSMPAKLILAVFVMGLVYMFLVIIKLYVLRNYFSYSFNETFLGFFAQNYLIVLASGIRLMAIWVLAFHLYHYAVMEIDTAKKYARLEVVAREAQLQQLAAQLNPHFFFNSLNSVKALISTNPVKARRAIDLLSDLLRNSLYRQNTDLISLHDEMSLVNDYLELEKIRFEERLQFTITIDEFPDTCSILPLSVQTLAENAIKHGIALQKDGGRIIIAIKRQEGCIRISVQSPGRLNSTVETNGLGLKNLKERLQLQYSNKASLNLTELPGDSVLSTITIPLS
ncbi:histidine kinase [Mucilaginibacter sp.]|uniref:sensor histidine kinase n=1 Tax=Mucilaginibacter sp. TaxID=1882438 RepID=UPI0025FEB077|nr:histidine kinase [Mucilaginibacter sp.]